MKGKVVGRGHREKSSRQEPLNAIGLRVPQELVTGPSCPQSFGVRRSGIGPFQIPY